jgi:hypothetical protein
MLQARDRFRVCDGARPYRQEETLRLVDSKPSVRAS